MTTEIVDSRSSLENKHFDRYPQLWGVKSFSNKRYSEIEPMYMCNTSGLVKAQNTLNICYLNRDIW